MFLDEAALRQLTGRKWAKLQIAQLRAMGVPFRVNALGRPVVAVSAVEGGVKTAPPAAAWEPAALKRA